MKQDYLVGTWAWARERRGALRFRDRVVVLAEGISLLLDELPSQCLGRMGLTRGTRVALPNLDLPRSTKAIDRAEAVCSAMTPQFLQSHSIRTYLWAKVLAAQDHVPPRVIDDELLYVSCLLHDLGLSGNPSSFSLSGCFTIVGASELRAIGLAADWESARIRRGEEAITLHLNPRVPPKLGVEAHLLTRSSQVDAIGIGYWRIRDAHRREVLRRSPRSSDQTRGFSALFDSPHHPPKSRARMYRSLGSKWWFYLNPEAD